jgi:hypothetical protein
VVNEACGIADRDDELSSPRAIQLHRRRPIVTRVIPSPKLLKDIGAQPVGFCVVRIQTARLSQIRKCIVQIVQFTPCSPVAFQSFGALSFAESRPRSSASGGFSLWPAPCG